MPELTTNFAVSTVATPPSPSTSGTSLVVAAGEGSRFPAAPFNATIAPEGVQATPANAEIVRVTAKSTDTLTITRAQESSSARAVVAGDRIWAGVTVKTLTDLEAALVGGVLASSTSVGATSITLNRSAAPVASGLGFVAIDPFTTSCEIRKVATVSGSSLTGLVALAKTHSAAAPVWFFHGASVPTEWFGCKGDAGSGDTGTDDSIPLQWALDEVGRIGIWLEGENRNHQITQPMMLSQSAKVRHMGIKCKSTFAPIDTNGAALMNIQGTVMTYTAVGSTDVVTAASAHGLVTDTPVVLKGTMPGGLTSGRVYYARDTTSTTFKLSATLGGSAIDLTSDGSGYCYPQALQQQKVYFEDVIMNGFQVAGTLNGAALSVQQPGVAHKLRIDSFKGVGLTLCGQQMVFENFESINCGTALSLENMTEAYFVGGFNLEQCTNKGIHVPATSPIFGQVGAYSCIFEGVHIEMLGGSSSRVFADFEAGAQNLLFTNCQVSMSVVGQKAFWFRAGSPAQSSYRILNLRISGGDATNRPTAIQDDDGQVVLDTWDDSGTFTYQDVGRPLLPASQGYTDTRPYTVVRTETGYIKWGSQNDAQPSMQFRPATDQTGEQTLWRNTAGTAMLGVTPTGAVRFTEQSDPAAPAANTVLLYSKDVGGKTALFARFPTGAVQQITIEP